MFSTSSTRRSTTSRTSTLHGCAPSLSGDWASISIPPKSAAFGSPPRLHSDPALPGDLVKSHRPSGGDVEGAHLSRHRDPRHVIARPPHQRPYAGSLAAEHQRG